MPDLSDSQVFSQLGQMQARVQQVTAEYRADQRDNEANFREVSANLNRQQVDHALLRQRLDRLETDLNQGFASLREQIKATLTVTPAVTPTATPITRQIAAGVACAIAISACTSLLTLTYGKSDSPQRPTIAATK